VVEIQRGVAYLYYAFDVGSAINLEEADKLLAATKKQSPFLQKKKISKYFEFTPAPIRVEQVAQPFEVSKGFFTDAMSEILIFDFGSLSVRFQIPLEGALEDIIQLSVDLYENFQMRGVARQVAESLLNEIAPSVLRPDLAEGVEDYWIFQISETKPNLSPSDIVQNHMQTMAKILKAETSALSDREIQEILSDRISYGINDITFLNWYSAIIFDERAEDIYRVLEFANIVLMELSHLDEKLDKALDEFYEEFSKEQDGLRNVFARLTARRNQRRRFARFQIDSAIFFERVTNSLKLMGDDFQARVYQVASKKMGLSAWDASINKKLRTIESIYDKISDSEATRRMEVLEWIIIILIALSIYLGLK
jgi:hypothetical protein